MAWGRVVQVLLGIDPTDPAEVIEISGLELEGKIVRSSKMTENHCELTIYNASKSTRNRIESEGRSCIVKLGYEDSGSGIVFLGQVDSASSSHVGPDWVTKISAVCARAVEFGFGTTPVALSFAPDTRLSVVLRAMSEILGIGLLGEQNAENIPCGNGFTFVGSAREALSKLDAILKSNACGLHMDLGELVVYRGGLAISEFEGLYLDKDCGLLSANPAEDRTKELRLVAKSKATQEKARKRHYDAKTTKQHAAALQTLQKAQKKEEEVERVQAKVRALIDHRARPNGIAKIASPAVNGPFVIDQVTFEFDNMGKKFEMELEVSA